MAVMERVRMELQSILVKLREESGRLRRAEIIGSFWRLIARKDRLPYIRLLFEVQILAIQNPRRYRRYLVHTSGSWLKLIQSFLPANRNTAAVATLNAAVIDGLLLELLSTGNLRRTSDALNKYIAILVGSQERRGSARG